MLQSLIIVLALVDARAMIASGGLVRTSGDISSTPHGKVPSPTKAHRFGAVEPKGGIARKVQSSHVAESKGGIARKVAPRTEIQHLGAEVSPSGFVGIKDVSSGAKAVNGGSLIQASDDEAPFVLGDMGVKSCPSGYAAITNPDDCEIAATGVGLNYSGENDWSDGRVCNAWSCDPCDGARLTSNAGSAARYVCELQAPTTETPTAAPTGAYMDLVTTDGRCDAAPFGGWGYLGSLANVSNVEECKEACLNSTQCQAMSYRSSNNKCSGFTSCNSTSKPNKTFQTWEKKVR